MDRHLASTGTTLGLIGLGAFGRLAAAALRPYFDIIAHDTRPDGAEVARGLGIGFGALVEVATCDVVVLAVPWRALDGVGRTIAPVLRPGAVVVDVASIKVEPMAVLAEVLPQHVELVGTHPLFGPQSARSGLKGHRVAVCADGGRAGRRAVVFLRRRLGLRVIATTPEAHDRDMAYVQAVSHVVARAVKAIAPPPGQLTTTTWDHLTAMVDLVGGDSQAVFATILADNPYARGAVDAFLDAARSQFDRAGAYVPEAISRG